MKMCEFEDSQNCIWLANTSGNKQGDSFIDILGTTLYAEHLIALAILAVFLWSLWLMATTDPNAT